MHLNNYIDQIEHTCIIKNNEVERLEKEKEMKNIINKKYKKKNDEKKGKKEKEKKGFFLDKKMISFDWS